jgi:ornithine carbamoyltransferase
MSQELFERLRSIRHFPSIRLLEPDALKALTDFALVRKQQFKRGELKPTLQGKVLAMIFQKSSLRTRIAFEAAMTQLGGHAINLEDHQIGIKQRESIADVARVVSSMCDGIAARVSAHQMIVELIAHSSVPVINALSDWAHPCQALSDLMTIHEHYGDYVGRKLAFIGDGNNVARSLLNACAGTGMHFSIACPQGYGIDGALIEFAKSLAARSGATVEMTDKPYEAVKDADVVYTDVWTSMGQESEQNKREADFAGFQVSSDLMKQAKPTAIAMHCLPANRGKEITDAVIDGPQSKIFLQAENRLHSQRALLELLLGRDE